MTALFPWSFAASILLMEGVLTSPLIISSSGGKWFMSGVYLIPASLGDGMAVGVYLRVLKNSETRGPYSYPVRARSRVFGKRAFPNEPRSGGDDDQAWTLESDEIVEQLWFATGMALHIVYAHVAQFFRQCDSFDVRCNGLSAQQLGQIIN